MSKRPKVICLMTTSVDGKILTANWGNDPRVKKMLSKFEETHNALGIGAWIVGRTTMERDFTKFAKPILVEIAGPISREDFNAAGDAESFAIAIDGSAKLGWKSPEISGDHVITILTESVPDGYLAHLRGIGLSYIFAGKEKVDLGLALEKLRSVFGIEALMLEGGGHINGSFLNEGLVDEFHQLLLPLADGRHESTGVFEVGEDARKIPFALMKLQEVKHLEEDVVWLRYVVE